MKTYFGVRDGGRGGYVTRIFMEDSVVGSLRYDCSFDFDLATPCTEYDFDRFYVGGGFGGY